MAAQRGGAADLDGGHDAPLGEAQMRPIDGTPDGAVAAEDIRHFELRTRHGRRVSRCDRRQVQVFERALDLPDQVDGHAGIAGGRLDMPVSEQVLDHPNVDLASSRWVAKLWRNVWTVTDLLRPAASAARRQASCSARLVIGRAGLRPGNSQCDGRVDRQ